MKDFIKNKPKELIEKIRDKDNNSLLGIAVKLELIDIIYMLIDTGVNINHTNV